VDFGLEVRDDMWVPHGSEGERGSWVPVREGLLGHGPKAGLGRFVSPSAFLVIFLLSSFSFFCFLISFLDFAY
jgi:hypothetical protein